MGDGNVREGHLQGQDGILPYKPILAQMFWLSKGFGRILRFSGSWR
jgi:hypothetical protein